MIKTINKKNTESQTSPSFQFISMQFEWHEGISEYAQIISDKGKDNYLSHQPAETRMIEEGLWYNSAAGGMVFRSCSRPPKEIIDECYEAGHVFEEDGYILFCI